MSGHQLPFAEVNLASLNPEWMVQGQRYGLGIRVDCPAHPWHCRLEFPFSRPEDGLLPLVAPVLYGHAMRAGELETLTLWTALPVKHAGIEVPHHWRGFCADGIFYRAWSLG